MAYSALNPGLYGECPDLLRVISDVERKIHLLTLLLAQTKGTGERADIQLGIDLAGRELEGLRTALAAAGCEQLPTNYSGHSIYVSNGDERITVYPLTANGD